MTPRLCIMARIPEPGQTKTRLIPSLGPQAAASLSAAMTQDTLDLAQHLYHQHRCEVRVILSGDPKHPWVRTLPFAWEPQHKGTLGERLAWAMTPGQPTVFIGTDAPTLPITLLGEVLDALQRNTIPFIPTFDGGYAAIGTPDPAVFTQIPWSTPLTLTASVQRARALGHSVTLLPFWYDIDEPEDLDFLCNHLAILPPEVAPRTRAFLQASPPLRG